MLHILCAASHTLEARMEFYLPRTILSCSRRSLVFYSCRRHSIESIPIKKYTAVRTQVDISFKVPYKISTS